MYELLAPLTDVRYARCIDRHPLLAELIRLGSFLFLLKISVHSKLQVLTLSPVQTCHVHFWVLDVADHAQVAHELSIQGMEVLISLAIIQKWHSLHSLLAQMLFKEIFQRRRLIEILHTIDDWEL